MTSKEKDDLCDNNREIIEEMIRSKNVNIAPSHLEIEDQNAKTENKENSKKLKRQLTSASYCDGENSQDDENNPFIFITRGNKRKQRSQERNTITISDNSETDTYEQNRNTKANRNNNRIFVNSRNQIHNNKYTNTKQSSKDISHCEDTRRRTQYHNQGQNCDDSGMSHRQMSKPNHDQHETDKTANPEKNKENIFISQKALNFAAEQHLPPLHIKCTPKLNDHQKGKEIVKALFLHIDNDFKKLNKYFIKPLGFEYWFIDKNGDLICFAKDIELFVFLCDVNNYPKMLLQTEILPSKPKHLPSQHSLIMKYVPNYITIEEMQKEVNIHINTLFNIEEMNGSKTSKSRHLRIEIKSSVDYEKLMRQGGLTIDGQIFELNEFLPPPRILICSKCNDPGHVRKDCKFEYDACRRCGDDRSIGNHNECIISCHRCKQNHSATDYQCQYLIEYRRMLLQQLKQKPYLIPPNVKLFVPTEYRKDGDNDNKIVSSRIAKSNTNEFNKTMINNQNNPIPFNINRHAWPTLEKQQSNSIISTYNDEIWKEIRSRQYEIDKLKEDLNLKIQQSQDRYEDHAKKIKSILLIISAQNKHQQENVERCYTILNDFMPLLSATLTLFQKLTTNFNEHNKTAGNDKNNETSDLVQYISNSINYMKDRNDTLITSQRSLNSLVEQQGQLLFQAINNLDLNNE
ncbi:unnamed protein product [Rotaria magnacalcarata]|nr:unnamed protein product [Rotaria magnacalcarata]